MSKSKVFIGIAISFAAGVLVASAINLPKEGLYLVLAVSIIFFALAFAGKNQLGALMALFLFCFILGSVRLNAAIKESEFAGSFGQTVNLEGYVAEEPDVRDGRQLLHFLPKDHSQKIIVTVSNYQEFFYGDLITVSGKLAEPKSFNDFDYKGYLERYNVYAQMSYPKVLILKSHRLNPIKENLLKVKAAFVKRLAQLFTEPQNSLLLGILIGAKKTLPTNIVDNFNITGTSHIIAVSGFNITIMIYALANLARVFGRRFSFWLTCGVIAGFVIITGASASVVRAAIMGFLLLLSFNIGRQYSVVPALFLAALLMLVINPKILFWDVGFQLSFAATLGIIYFMPVAGKLTERWPDDLGIKTTLLTTLSAIVATLPLILFDFGRLSLVAPLVNILVLPAVPGAMLLGFLSTLPFFGSGFAFAANIILLYILKITEWFAGLRYASLNVKISIYVFWLLVAIVFGLYWLLARLVTKSNRVEKEKQV
jgi:competence protein ComEC